MCVDAGLGAAGGALSGAAAAALGALTAAAAKLKELLPSGQDAQSLAGDGVLEAGGQIAALAGLVLAPIQQCTEAVCILLLA